ncbi:unnamed protein product [Acanthocheilonema viteae]|uniref:Uncharacterized protein n=1 Tax=Acanthocheilonema viteae TaxID=6277 RepID=A0A498SV17_ACAVI|nr:unnamed protein product [Acanthocheilonema viteae]
MYARDGWDGCTLQLANDSLKLPLRPLMRPLIQKKHTVVEAAVLQPVRCPARCTVPVKCGGFEIYIELMSGSGDEMGPLNKDTFLEGSEGKRGMAWHSLGQLLLECASRRLSIVDMSRSFVLPHAVLLSLLIPSPILDLSCFILSHDQVLTFLMNSYRALGFPVIFTS